MRQYQPILVLLSLALCSACATAQPSTQAFSACLDQVSVDAAAIGISPAVSSALLKDLTPNPRVLQLDRQQPEFTQTFGNYLETRVSHDRIQRGRQQLERQAPVLEPIANRHGIPAPVLVAFWGLETNYGRHLGSLSTVRSLATLACDSRRPEFFRQELLAVLQLVDDGVVTPEQLKGSWAGAVGNFQFLPSVYRDHAVDADGDGNIDLWSNFSDAAESAARFLLARGWEPGQRWGREVALPENFDYRLSDSVATVDEWATKGLRQATGRPLPRSSISATLLLPAGATGPAFLVYPNFDVIMRWNPSQFYALSVGHLADRLGGAGPLANPPPEEIPLSTEMVTALQQQLVNEGFDPGPIDGRMGPATRSAIRDYQVANALLPDGHPDPTTLEKLKLEPLPR